MGVINYSDWFLGSKDEVLEMHDELHLYGLGNFNTSINYSGLALYHTSSEYTSPPTLAEGIDFLTGTNWQDSKSLVLYVRPIRSFVGAVGEYAIRDIGPAGGRIFAYTGGRYFEACPFDLAPCVWSNIITGLTTTGTAIGTGQANTTAIISQAGHTDSAAKLCDDLIVSVGSITPPPLVSYSASRIYTFYITVGSSLLEVFPLNFLESSLVDSQKDNEIFYRRVFSGTLTFTNLRGDYDIFYAIHEVDPCSKIFFQIKRAGILYWHGYFSTTDGKWDIDRCTFEVTPFTLDDYTDILEKADTQYDILLIYSKITTRAIHGIIDIYYRHNRWLNDVINFLALKISATATVSSTFFTAATNPVTLGTNKLINLTIAQKSDIIRPTSTDPARQAMMSWNELMDILWNMWQVRWNYDSVTDTINVEHISWFTSSPGMDLRTQLLCKATNKFSYVKEKMPKFEKFLFMEANNPNFTGLIWYNSACVNQNPDTNVKETSVKVTTDLEYIINNPTAISDEGFVILCNYYNSGELQVETAIGVFTTDVRLNMRLSWANLHNAYFRHNRVLIEGIMNGSAITFWSAQKTIKQECFAIICPSDSYNPANEITTELGETYFSGVKASVEQSELSPSGEMKFSLLYGPPDNIPAVITDPIVDESYLLATPDTMLFDYDDDTASEYQSAQITMSDGAAPFTVNMSSAAWAEYDVYAIDNNTQITGNPALWLSGCYLRIFPINANGGAERSGIVEISGTGVTSEVITISQLATPATVSIYAGDIAIMTISSEIAILGIGGIHVAFTPHYVPGGDVHYDVCWFVYVNGVEGYSSGITGLACTNDSYKNSSLIATPGLDWGSGDVIDVYLYYESAPGLS